KGGLRCYVSGFGAARRRHGVFAHLPAGRLGRPLSPGGEPKRKPCGCHDPAADPGGRSVVRRRCGRGGAVRRRRGAISGGRGGRIRGAFGRSRLLLGQRALGPDARGGLAGRVAHDALALPLAGLEHAFVDIAVRIGRDASPVDLTGLPAADIAEAVGHHYLALAFALAGNELTGIDRAVGIARDTLAFAAAVLPVTLVGIAVRIGHLARPVVLAALEGAYVDQPVGIDGRPHAFDDPVLPVA